MYNPSLNLMLLAAISRCISLNFLNQDLPKTLVAVQITSLFWVASAILDFKCLGNKEYSRFCILKDIAQVLDSQLLLELVDVPFIYSLFCYRDDS
jgi:hypothetical protein